MLFETFNLNDGGFCMISWLTRTFIPDYMNTEDVLVREKYGTLASVVSIICNIVLCIFKFIVGAISHSVAIQADAFNNLSDAGSNIATLFGFKLANKHPDSDHPYGHGRIEYVTGLMIAFLILMIAFSSFKESLAKIFHPETVSFSIVTITVLIGSILVKLWMGYFNKQFGKAIDSPSLLAAGQDSMNDVVSTIATLVSVVFAYFNDFPIDGYVGLFVSIFVFKAGLEVFSDTVSPLLGQAPDPKLISDIYSFVMKHEEIIGVHDMIVHDYGPSRLFVTLHAEVRADANILEIHDLIDEIERTMAKQFGCLATIHMDPVDIDDHLTNELREKMKQLVVEIDPNYTIHDFRVVSGPTHTNLIFDIVLPPDDQRDETSLKALISEKVKEWNQTYFVVLNIDHSYI